MVRAIRIVIASRADGLLEFQWRNAEELLGYFRAWQPNAGLGRWTQVYATFGNMLMYENQREAARRIGRMVTVVMSGEAGERWLD